MRIGVIAGSSRPGALNPQVVDWVSTQRPSADSIRGPALRCVRPADPRRGDPRWSRHVRERAHEGLGGGTQPVRRTHRRDARVQPLGARPAQERDRLRRPGVRPQARRLRELRSGQGRARGGGVATGLRELPRGDGARAPRRSRSSPTSRTVRSLRRRSPRRRSLPWSRTWSRGQTVRMALSVLLMGCVRGIECDPWPLASCLGPAARSVSSDPARSESTGLIRSLTAGVAASRVPSQSCRDFPDRTRFVRSGARRNDDQSDRYHRDRHRRRNVDTTRAIVETSTGGVSPRSRCDTGRLSGSSMAEEHPCGCGRSRAPGARRG